MAWFVAGVMIATFVYSMYMQSKLADSGKPSAITGATAGEGIPIPVVFGTKEVNPNIAWYGDLWSTPIQGGFGYQFSLHLMIAQGRLDQVLAIKGSDKVVSMNSLYGVEGGVMPLTEDGIVTLNSNNGKHPDSSQEGVYGLAEVSLGGANNTTVDSGVCDYLAQQMGMDLGPRYRGVANALLKNVDWGPSPYIRPISFLVRRIHHRNGGDEMWYDEKAEIRIGRAANDIWKWKLAAPGDTTDYSSPTYDDSGWDQGKGGISNVAPGPAGDWMGNAPPASTALPQDGDWVGGNRGDGAWVKKGLRLWMRWDLGPMPAMDLGVRCWHDDCARLWFNGTEVTLWAVDSTTDPKSSQFNSQGVVPASLVNPEGPNVVAYRVRDTFNDFGDAVGTNNRIFGALELGSDTGNPVASVDMNPAHIIYETLTDDVWGMGYPEADLDEASFQAAADKLYDEKLGISYVWNQQTTIEDFLNTILQHINGVLYVDRSTGLYVLKLVRNDYNEEELTVLDGTNVSKLEEVTRKTAGELVNEVTVTYACTPRGDQGSWTISDESLYQAQGGVVNSKIDYPGITQPFNAAKLALRDLRLLSSPLLSCKVYTTRHAGDFQIGQPFVLDWSPLGIDHMVMRVMGVDLGDGVDDGVKVDCVEDAFFFPSEATHLQGNDPVAPPLVPFPNPFAAQDIYFTAQEVDPRNRGMVECAFNASAWGEGSVFSGWTQTEPGVMVRDATGPIDDGMLDGVNPFTGEYESGLGTGYSWAVGRKVFALAAEGDTPGKPFQGPYVVDDIGGHWENYGTEQQAFVATNARMHRASGFDQSSDFSEGMLVQLRKGSTREMDLLRLDTSGVILDSTAMEWTLVEGPTFNWTDNVLLLRSDQFDGVNLSTEPLLTMSRTQVNSEVDFDGFETLPGTPGTKRVPPGPWRFTFPPCWLEGASGGSTTTLGLKVYRDSATVGEVLFQVVSQAITGDGLQVPASITYTAPEFKLAVEDRLVIIPVLHTTSSTPATLTIEYNGVNAIKVKLPKPDPAPAATEDEDFFDVYINNSGCINPHGHKMLRVHGGGHLKGIFTLSSLFSKELVLSFAEDTLVDNMSTDTLSLWSKPLRLESGSEEGISCPTDGEMRFRLLSTHWKLVGGSWS